MATSTQYISPNDPDNIVIVSKEKNWTDIKVYAKGSLQYKSDNGEDLRTGRNIEIEGLGMLQLYLGSELEVRVDGVKFAPGKAETESKVTNVSVIFWVLCGFSVFGLLFLFLALNTPFINTQLLQILIGLQILSILVYGATALLIRRGIYWFYFVGAGMYTVFSLLTLLDIQTQLGSFANIIALVIRFVLLILVLRILPIFFKEMRKVKASDGDDIILDQQ